MTKIEVPLSFWFMGDRSNPPHKYINGEFGYPAPKALLDAYPERYDPTGEYNIAVGTDTWRYYKIRGREGRRTKLYKRGTVLRLDIGVVRLEGDILDDEFIVLG